MIATLAIVSAHLLVAALGRKREVGFGKALLYSVLLTPFISLPVVLKSKKLPPKPPKDSTSRPLQVGDSVHEPQARYGYKEGGEVISDSIILSEKGWSTTVSAGPDMVPPERQRQVEPSRNEGKGMHV